MTTPQDPRDPAGEPGRDEDALWRSIIEHYGDRPELDEPDDDPEWEVPGSPRGLDEDDDDVAASYDREEHYVPPAPPPVPRPTTHRLIAWVGLFGVPAFVLIALVLRIALPSWVGLLLMAWFVGGFIYLVATMRPDNHDGYDDGAVV